MKVFAVEEIERIAEEKEGELFAEFFQKEEPPAPSSWEELKSLFDFSAYMLVRIADCKCYKRVCEVTTAAFEAFKSYCRNELQSAINYMRVSELVDDEEVPFDPSDLLARKQENRQCFFDVPTETEAEQFVTCYCDEHDHPSNGR